MDKKIAEIPFKLTGDTKNNYTFEQSIADKETLMFPKKIYLNKKLFKQEPKKGIILEIK